MITVYGREDCIQCEWTKRWLTKLGHEYRDVDIDADDVVLGLIAPGFTTLPIVVTDSETWAGFKLDKIRSL